jgi:hypothetical protein
MCSTQKRKHNSNAESVLHISLLGEVTLMDIKELKPQEMQEIIDFYHHIEDYGHIFHFEPEKLDEPFKKIIEGISEIRKMMDDSYGM